MFEPRHVRSERIPQLLVRASGGALACGQCAPADDRNVPPVHRDHAVVRVASFERTQAVSASAPQRINNRAKEPLASGIGPIAMPERSLL